MTTRQEALKRRLLWVVAIPAAFLLYLAMMVSAAFPTRHHALANGAGSGGAKGAR